MNNKEFKLLPYEVKLEKLIGAVYVKLGKKYGKAFLSSILYGIDLDKQLSVEKITEEDLKSKFCVGQYIQLGLDNKTKELDNFYIKLLLGQSIAETNNRIFRQKTCIHKEIKPYDIQDDLLIFLRITEYTRLVNDKFRTNRHNELCVYERREVIRGV